MSSTTINLLYHNSGTAVTYVSLFSTAHDDENLYISSNKKADNDRFYALRKLELSPEKK